MAEDNVSDCQIREDDQQVKLVATNGEESKLELLPEEKKIGLYSSNQKILLVGEGDFSFSACLAAAFGSATNIVATSLDSRESLELKYSRAARNLKDLEERGCRVLHEVDAHTMSSHPGLVQQLFDRIVFNFPHAGFSFVFREHDDEQIEQHQELVKGFLRSARAMLSRTGQVHVTHKTAYPFRQWDVIGLAREAGLSLASEHWFTASDYPGYVNRRGDGARSDKSFPIGSCSTFVFALNVEVSDG